MMVHPDKANRLIGTVRDCIADLRRYENEIDRATLRTDRDRQHMVAHALYVAAQATVDLALHVSADAGLPKAGTYQDSFARLCEAGIIDRTLAEKLAGWAGFRNVLAHLYAFTDYDRVYDAISEIDDLDQFVSIIEARIDAESS